MKLIAKFRNFLPAVRETLNPEALALGNYIIFKAQMLHLLVRVSRDEVKDERWLHNRHLNRPQRVI